MVVHHQLNQLVHRCESKCEVRSVERIPKMTVRVTFDEDGIMPNFCYWRENALFMQYGGWSLRNSVPYSNWLGLAVSYDKGESFSKVFENPILDRAENELYSATCSWMIEDEKDG